jgi:quercetin dioxygenase-like cupin family protein
MREIRTFDIQYDEPATVWRAARPLVVEVEHGVLWLTIEGDAEDYWLDAGQSFLLPAGAKAWIGAGRGDVRLTVTSAGSLAALCRNAALACPQLGSGRARLAPSWPQAVA